jgi:hypothetical protein
MEQFTLTYEVKKEDNLVKLRVYPSNEALQNNLESWLNESEISQLEIDNFVTEQTALLFNELQNSNITNKENYTL